ncbi:MAG: hypothetical protein MK102_11590 [Fuerstiella sp.]|nr:hypothetical protein [Fuerstiella sp.]
MAKQVAIGEDLWLFHGNSGRSEFLCITSHGATLKTSFTVPRGIRLHYYAPRDHILKMHADFRLGIKVEEEIDEGQVSPDYDLSKFQGKKRGSETETYGSIMTRIDSTRKSIDAGIKSFEEFGRGLPQNNEMEKKMVRRGYVADFSSKVNLLPMDILTIRARGLRKFNIGNVKLSKVLETLRQNGIYYPYVFCSFCRYTSGKATHTTTEY